MLPELEGYTGRKNLTFQETSPHGAGEQGLRFGGRKNKDGEIQNKINTHKSKVIPGHWHQDGVTQWARSHPFGKQVGCLQASGNQEGNGLNLWKRDTQPRSSLVRASHLKRHQRKTVAPAFTPHPPTHPQLQASPTRDNIYGGTRGPTYTHTAEGREEGLTE